MPQALPNRPPNQPGTAPKRPWDSPWIFLILGLLVMVWLWRSSTTEATRPEVAYSVFYEWVQAGKVQEVELEGQNVEGTLDEPQTVEGAKVEEFRTTAPLNDEGLLPLLREHGVRIDVAPPESQPWVLQLAIGLLPWVLLIALWIWLSKRAQRMTGPDGPLGGILKQRSRKFDKASQVNVTFDDVAGLKSAKRDLQEVVQFLSEPERFRRLGGRVPRGVLLIGPPGTGKTLLARAVAGESGVPFYSISGSEFIEMFVGVGAARVRELFAEAKKHAPAIIFIDEIDAVGRSRGAGLGGGHDEREQTLNQLLSEMDGFERNDLTIVLAATNRPDVLDPALLRPGRFDRRVVVDRPELDARRAILAVHLKKKPVSPAVDLETIARNTAGFSGADLANLVNEAALTATRRGADTIESSDFNEAYDKIVLGDPRETRLEDAERRRVAVHESGHALSAWFSTDAEPLHRVSIIPRGMALGVTQQLPGEERHLMTQPQLQARLRMLMSGYAAERVVLGDISSGAENDLKVATGLAAKMVAHYGMSERVGPLYIEHAEEHPFLGQRIATGSAISDVTTREIEAESRALLEQALADASELLTEHRPLLDRLVEELLARETLEKAELAALLAAAPDPVTDQGL